jgi:hypothetical protein
VARASLQASLFEAGAWVRGGEVFLRSQRGLFGGKKRLTGNNVSFSEIK